MPYVLEPEVPGELGERCVLDASVHPPRVVRLHVNITGWLGDDLAEVSPVYLVSETLAATLDGAKFTGFELAEADVSVDDEALIAPSLQLPTFTWLKITGGPGDDLRLASDYRLELSDRAFALVSQASIEHCEVEGL